MGQRYPSLFWVNSFCKPTCSGVWTKWRKESRERAPIGVQSTVYHILCLGAFFVFLRSSYSEFQVGNAHFLFRAPTFLPEDHWHNDMTKGFPEFPFVWKCRVQNNWELGISWLQCVQDNCELWRKWGPTGKNRFEWSPNLEFQLGNLGLFLELRLSDLKITDVMICPCFFQSSQTSWKHTFFWGQIMTSVIFKSEL